MSDPLRPPLHVLAYGEPGSGKSEFAASFPKPMLVCLHDPPGKATRPYLSRGVAQPVERIALEGTKLRIPTQRVLSKKTGKLLIQVEHYFEGDPENPKAYNRFFKRKDRINEECERGEWATVVDDSLTYLELSARKYDQYKTNPDARDPRKWYGASGEQVEQMVMMRFASLPCNVVVIAHVNELEDELRGTLVRNPAAPGKKLPKKLASAFEEFYYCYVDGRGDAARYLMQTRMGDGFNANTAIHAPDPCENSYRALWSVWDEENAA